MPCPLACWQRYVANIHPHRLFLLGKFWLYRGGALRFWDGRLHWLTDMLCLHRRFCNVCWLCGTLYKWFLATLLYNILLLLFYIRFWGEYFLKCTA
jgi:hypothetical protein